MQEIAEPIRNIRPSDGFAWVAQVPLQADGDNPDEPKRSKVVLLEDGKPLGPAHTAHAAVRELGRGRYSHWQDYLLFSTRDNSDPRKNGRAYQALLHDDADTPQLDADGLDLEAAYELFRQNDLLIVRNFIPADRVAYFRAVAEDLYAEQDRLFKAGQITDLRTYQTGFLFDGQFRAATGGAFSMYDIPGTPALHELVSHFFAREGCTAWRYFGGQLRRVSAAAQAWSTTTKWHNDQYGVVDDGFLLVVNSPLMPIGFDAPGLAFVKSERSRIQEHVRWDPSKPYTTDADGQSTRIDGTAFAPDKVEAAFGNRIVRPRLNLGDVAIFSAWTIHSAYILPGMTGWRVGVENRFKEVGASLDGSKAR
jgi:hypothetical protein